MKKKIIVSIIILVVTLFAFSTVNFADIDPNDYKDIYTAEGSSDIFKMGSMILGVAQVVGLAVAVIMLTMLGIRYMLGAVEQKASIKKEMMPFVIGACIFFGATSLIKLIMDAVNVVFK